MLQELLLFSGDDVEAVVARVRAALAGGRLQVLLVDGRWGSHSTREEVAAALDGWPADERAALMAALGDVGIFLAALARRAPLAEGWDAPFGGRGNFPNGGQAPLVCLFLDGLCASRGGPVVPYADAARLYTQPQQA